jgi:hypothetical protein
MRLNTLHGLALAAATLGLASCADTMGMMGGNSHLTAALYGASEVPAVTTPATGTATVEVDRGTRVVRWIVTYDGLSGPLRAVHFHGPAAPGANAPVVVPLSVGPSPIEGQAQLSDINVADLIQGRYYINLHTAANPNGEIRGQVVPAN